MIFLLCYTLSGIIGYLLILKAYHMLFGKLTTDRIFHQLPAIIIGPIAILLGLLLIWDIYFDPPCK